MFPWRCWRSFVFTLYATAHCTGVKNSVSIFRVTEIFPAMAKIVHHITSSRIPVTMPPCATLSYPWNFAIEHKVRKDSPVAELNEHLEAVSVGAAEKTVFIAG